MTIAYFDMVDSCYRIDCIISEMLRLDSEIHKEVDNALRITKMLKP